MADFSQHFPNGPAAGCLNPRAQPGTMDRQAGLWQSRPMNFDWRHRVILGKLGEGCLLREAAAAAGISRQAVLKRVNASAEFRQAVAAARELGASERVYRAWVSHYRRGLRPPAGKGTRSTPRFRYGRR